MGEGLRDNTADSRFELELDGGLAFISYRRVGQTLWLNHAEVPAALGGRGLGSALVRQALELIRSRGERMVPGCPFVAWFVRQHPEYADLCEEHGTSPADAVGGTGVEIAPALLGFINEEALPGTGIAPQSFWQGLVALLRELAPVNRALLSKRDALQTRIDAWHERRPGAAGFGTPYEAMLREIGYLVPEGAPFSIETTNVDAEIATLAGPQLVVPVSNARYALNAANARWGSLYDAVYGTDVLAESDGAARGAAHRAVRRPVAQVQGRGRRAARAAARARVGGSRAMAARRSDGPHHSDFSRPFAHCHQDRVTHARSRNQQSHEGDTTEQQPCGIYERLNGVIHVRQRNDIHCQTGVATAQLRDDVVQIIGIFELHQDMGHFVRVVKALLCVSEAEKNEGVIRALRGRENAGDLAGLIA